jgi:hypothetical protein
MKHFTTLEELNAEWEINGACEEGIEFNQSCKSLEEILEDCPLDFRLWRLVNGYEQFADHCPWDELSGWDWVYLLRDRPEFSEFCPWKKLSGMDWIDLLRFQPHFAEFCPKNTDKNT